MRPQPNDRRQRFRDPEPLPEEAKPAKKAAKSTTKTRKK